MSAPTFNAPPLTTTLGAAPGGKSTAGRSFHSFSSVETGEGGSHDDSRQSGRVSASTLGIACHQMNQVAEAAACNVADLPSLRDSEWSRRHHWPICRLVD